MYRINNYKPKTNYNKKPKKKKTKKSYGILCARWNSIKNNIEILMVKDRKSVV